MVRGPATTNAILSFQKWERLERTGLLNRRTKARLATAKHPTPIGKAAAGKRAEVLLDRQVALLIDDNKVVRTVAVSPEGVDATPPGNYRVYAKIPRWWSVPFREWLPWALPRSSVASRSTSCRTFPRNRRRTGASANRSRWLGGPTTSRP